MEHLQAIKRVLRYLKGTKDHGLHIKPCDRLALYRYSDVGWPGTSDDRRSIAGYYVYFGGNLVSWSFKKQ